MASSRGVFGSSLFSEAVAAEFDAIGIVNDAIEDGIGQRWVADDLVPTVFEAPSTATKISASRTTPVSGSTIPIFLPE